MMNSEAMSRFIDQVARLMATEEDESGLIRQVSTLARSAALTPGLIQPGMFEADEEVGFGSTLICDGDGGAPFVVVDSWLPGRGVNPHNHGTWAVVVGLSGVEKNTYWRRTDTGGDGQALNLQQVGEQRVGVGDVIAMKTGDIHSVQNETDETTLSFHVYGLHLNHTGRSQFDLETGREIPFLVDV